VRRDDIDFDVPQLPDGQITQWPVQPFPQKFSDFQKPQITGIAIGVSFSQRGAARDRHGRWERDAVDAIGALDETRLMRTVKSCGPDAPTLASSLRKDSQAMVANKPGHQGEHEGPR
jgi:hypothetical protein